MSLRGELREFGLLDLLSLAYATRKSGTLVVRSSSATVETLFDGGRLADVRIDDASSVFADAIVRTDDISPEQLRSALSSLSPADAAYSTALLQVSGRSREELLQIATERALQLFDRMVIWSEGSFDFDTASEVEVPSLSLDLNLTSVVERVRARHQEWQRLQLVWPDLNISLGLAPHARERQEPITFQPSEWATVTMLCEQPNLRRVAAELQLDAFEVRQVADHLRHLGVAETRSEPATGNLEPTPPAEAAAAEAAPVASSGLDEGGRPTGVFTGPFGPGRR